MAKEGQNLVPALVISEDLNEGIRISVDLKKENLDLTNKKKSKDIEED